MNRLEELKQKYKELGEEIEKLEKQGKVWKPEKEESYYTIYSDGAFDRATWHDSIPGNKRYAIGNCFRTKEEAEATVEKLKIYTQLKRLAEEINTEPVDTKSPVKNRYHICLSTSQRGLTLVTTSCWVHTGVIYSTNKDFLDIAKERIGEENLLKLFEE